MEEILDSAMDDTKIQSSLKKLIASIICIEWIASKICLCFVTPACWFIWPLSGLKTRANISESVLICDEVELLYTESVQSFRILKLETFSGNFDQNRCPPCFFPFFSGSVQILLQWLENNWLMCNYNKLRERACVCVWERERERERGIGCGILFPQCLIVQIHVVLHSV